jgi:RNA polymerase sigma-70 factor (ECF subfamily)
MTSIPAKKPDELLPTRQSLLLRLKNLEDNVSWQKFFDTYWALIYGVARKSGLTDAEAQDVVQEVIIAVVRHIKDFEYDPKRSFKAWLLNTTRWRITDQWRKRLPMQQPATQPDNDSRRTSTVQRIPDPRTQDIDKIWDQEYETHILVAAQRQVMKRVKPKHYQVYDLYAVKKWPVQKVVHALNVSEALVYQVKSRIDRDLEKEIHRLQTQAI